MKISIDQYILDDLEGWLDTFVKEVKVELHNKGINASGNLSNSFEYRIERQSDGMHAIVEANNYLVYAEGGRTAGKVPYNFIDILEDWVNTKGISVPSQFKNARAFAGAIYHNIKTYGSKRHRENNPVDVVGPALDEMKPKLNDILENRLVIYANDALFS